MTVSEIIPANDKQVDLSGIERVKVNKLEQEGVNSAYLPPRGSGRDNEVDSDSQFSERNDSSDNDDFQSQNVFADKCEQHWRQEYLNELKEVEKRELDVLANSQASPANLGRLNRDIAELSQFASNPGAAVELSNLQSIRAIYKEKLLNNRQIELA